MVDNEFANLLSEMTDSNLRNDHLFGEALLLQRLLELAFGKITTKSFETMLRIALINEEIHTMADQDDEKCQKNFVISLNDNEKKMLSKSLIDLVTDIKYPGRRILLHRSFYLLSLLNCEDGLEPVKNALLKNTHVQLCFNGVKHSRDSFELTRLNVKNGLSFISGLEMAEASSALLKIMTNGSNDFMVSTALSALCTKSEKAYDLLFASLKTSNQADIPIILRAIASIKGIDDEKIVGCFASLFENTDSFKPAVIEEAIAIFGGFSHPAVGPILAPFLSSENLSWKRAAAEAFANGNFPEDQKVAAPLLECAKNATDEPLVIALRRTFSSSHIHVLIQELSENFESYPEKSRYQITKFLWECSKEHQLSFSIYLAFIAEPLVKSIIELIETAESKTSYERLSLFEDFLRNKNFIEIIGDGIFIRAIFSARYERKISPELSEHLLSLIPKNNNSGSVSSCERPPNLDRSILSSLPLRDSIGSKPFTRVFA